MSHIVELFKKVKRDVKENAQWSTNDIRRHPVYQRIRKKTKSGDDIDNLVQQLTVISHHNESPLFRTSCDEEITAWYRLRLARTSVMQEKEEILSMLTMTTAALCDFENAVIYGKTMLSVMTTNPRPQKGLYGYLSRLQLDFERYEDVIP